MRTYTVAIDGPSASGKSTVARRVAASLGAIYVDSGAVYRAITWKALGQGIDTTDAGRVVESMSRAKMTFCARDGALVLSVDGEEPGLALRSEAVQDHVSDVAAMPEVRREVVRRLRDAARFGSIVMEGRDIGTVVFPDSPFKFYLDASPDVRAQRRHAEQVGRQERSEIGRVRASLSRRDAKDSGRKVDPLVVAPGAAVIDTTAMSIDQVVAFIVGQVAPALGSGR